ncbi:4435_t:CDS:1, partial [Racocetra persica]
KQKEQILEIDKSSDHDEDDIDEIFDEIEYKSKELEELKSFSSDCVSIDEKSAEEIESEETNKIIEIKSLAVCLVVIEEILTGKTASVNKKPTIEEQLNKITEDTNIKEKYKESIRELFKNNKNLFANRLEELG